MSAFGEVCQEFETYDEPYASKLKEEYERHLQRPKADADREIFICNRQMEIEARRDAGRRAQLRSRIESGIATKQEYREFLQWIDVDWKEEVTWELVCCWRRRYNV